MFVTLTVAPGQTIARDTNYFVGFGSCVLIGALTYICVKVLEAVAALAFIPHEPINNID